MLEQFDKSRSKLLLAIQYMQLFLRQPSLGRQSIGNMKWYITKGIFECSG